MKLSFLILFFFGPLMAFTPQNGDTLNQKDAEGKKQGYWCVYGKDKPQMEYPSKAKVECGYYKDNRKHGFWEQFYANGQKQAEVNYNNNRPDGAYTLYYENGQIKEKGTWKSGRMIGDYTRYYASGQIQQEKYFNDLGKTEGQQKFYYENGQMELSYIAKSGKEEGLMQRFYPDGSLKETKEFQDGNMVEGSQKSFAAKTPVVENKSKIKKADVPLEGEVNMDKPLLNGYNITYNHNKQILQEGMFKNGKLVDGKFYKYKKNGRILRIEVYKDGAYVGNAPITEKQDVLTQ